MPPKIPEGDSLSPIENLHEHASLAILRDAKVEVAGAAGWLRGRLRKEPVEIFDINGTLLFVDFPVVVGGEIAGHVRTAASGVIGNPVVALEFGPRHWDFEAAARKLAPRVRKAFPRTTVSEPLLVCYSYPKLGVMFTVKGEQGPVRVVYDVADLSPIPERTDQDGREGAVAWSFYDSLTDAERRARLKRFNAAEEARLGIAAKARREIVAARTLVSVADLVAFRWQRTATKLLQFCSHYAYTHARGHHCFSLHGQQVNDYCAVATCQMILCYYRYYFTQDQIAPACGYNAGSGCPADQSPGYESMSCDHIDATFDSAPTWAKGRDQIDLLRPFKSGVPGHARACAGYSRTTWLFGGTVDEKLYIYDPWPWNADFALAGAITWEDWGAISHTNYVYTRIACP
jgi:hypothetical protein